MSMSELELLQDRLFELLKKLIKKVDKYGTVFADNTGLVLGSTGYTNEIAEKIAATSAAIVLTVEQTSKEINKIVDSVLIRYNDGKEAQMVLIGKIIMRFENKTLQELINESPEISDLIIEIKEIQTKINDEIPQIIAQE